MKLHPAHSRFSCTSRADPLVKQQRVQAKEESSLSSETVADESKALSFDVVNLLRFRTPVTMLAFAVIIVSEDGSGTEQAFQVEPLEQSALFRTMCTCSGCTNVAASCPRLKSSQPGLGHPHRGPCGRDCHQPEVFQVSPQTCAPRFLGSGGHFLPSQQKSRVVSLHDAERGTDDASSDFNCDHSRQASLPRTWRRCVNLVTFRRCRNQFSSCQNELLHAPSVNTITPDKWLRKSVYDYKHTLNNGETIVDNYVNDATHVDAHKMQT